MDWPAGYTITPEQMWEKSAPNVGQLILDDSAARSHVGIINQCAWSLTAIDAVKAGTDTSAVRQGLQQSLAVMPESQSFVDTMIGELELDSVESSQQFVTANKCAAELTP
ncbi:MAG: hypothetical protein ACRCXL_09020 [Dermatophilaceae bacterium]